jgi:hypothetical protein
MRLLSFCLRKLGARAGFFAIILNIGFMVLMSPRSFAIQIPDELKGIGITEHLGDQVFIDDYTFKDETRARR